MFSTCASRLRIFMSIKIDTLLQIAVLCLFGESGRMAQALLAITAGLARPWWRSVIADVRTMVGRSPAGLWMAARAVTCAHRLHGFTWDAQLTALVPRHPQS